jgi:phosphatidylglycerophosphatase A
MKLKQPIWPRFISSRTVIGLATLGPLGRRLSAPGTWGSLAGLMYFTVFFYPLGPIAFLLLCALGIYFAVAICGEAEFRIGRRDPGEVILDEFVAMPLCFLDWTRLLPAVSNHPWVIFIAGFCLFRLFDIWKPLGIRRLQRLPGGWGIVVDDVAAALASCLVLHLGAWGILRGF